MSVTQKQKISPLAKVKQKLKRSDKSQSDSDKNKSTKAKINFRRPFQSTQYILPIKDIYNGIIITKDGRYIKVIEVKPIAFLMMTPAQQARGTGVWYSYSRWSD